MLKIQANKMQIEKIVAKFALKNQRNFTTDGTYLWMFLFSKPFLKLISECLLVSYSSSRALKNNIFAYLSIPVIELFPLVYPDLESWVGENRWKKLKIVENSWK